MMVSTQHCWVSDIMHQPAFRIPTIASGVSRHVCVCCDGHCNVEFIPLDMHLILFLIQKKLSPLFPNVSLPPAHCFNWTV